MAQLNDFLENIELGLVAILETPRILLALMALLQLVMLIAVYS